MLGLFRHPCLDLCHWPPEAERVVDDDQRGMIVPDMSLAHVQPEVR